MAVPKRAVHGLRKAAHSALAATANALESLGDPMNPLDDRKRREFGRSQPETPHLESPNWPQLRVPHNPDISTVAIADDPRPGRPWTNRPALGYDPYESQGGLGGVTWNTTASKLHRPHHTDLRGLSQHIQTMRALKKRPSV